MSKHPDLKHENIEKKDKKHKKDKKKKRQADEEDAGDISDLAGLDEADINAQIAKLQNELAGSQIPVT